MYQSATRCISDRMASRVLHGFFLHVKKLRVETPTPTDQGRPLYTGRNHSADRGRSFHDRMIEFDRGTQIGGENGPAKFRDQARPSRHTSQPLPDLYPTSTDLYTTKHLVELGAEFGLSGRSRYQIGGENGAIFDEIPLKLHLPTT